MHARGNTDTLALMEQACDRPCFDTLAPLRARLEEITANLCSLYPENQRFAKMLVALQAAQDHLEAAQAARAARDAPGFDEAKSRLAADLDELGASEIDLGAWHLG